MRAASFPARSRWTAGGIALFLVLVCVCAATLAAVALVGGAPTALAKGPHVDVVSFDQEVDTASARFITGAIQTAHDDGAALLIIEMDTPGGDLDSMKAISQAILASPVP